MSALNQGPEGMIMGGRYRIVRLIGSGGMANVYLATDMSSGARVAIKILKPEFTADEEFIQRFDTEAKAASFLNHPNIVRVLAVGQEGAFRYMVQEYVEGVTAKELITQNGHLDWRVAVPIVIQVGMALDYAHQNGIVHRDIKPDNILITKDRIARVTDFGIARAANSNTITLTSGGALGSVHYFSPEQARGTFVGPSSDIYSLGVLLFEMLTGRVPFDGDTPVAIAIKHLQETPPLASGFIPGIPPGLDAIIQKAMQKHPDYRYLTIREMVIELDALMIDPNGTYGVISYVEPVDATTSQMQSMRHDANYGKLRDIETSIDRRRRLRTKDNILIIVLITVILAVLLGAGFLIFKMVKGTGSVDNTSFTVGDYVGKNIEDVKKQLADDKFTDYEIAQKTSRDIDPNIVLEQSIEAGVVIKPDNGLHKLVLTISVAEETFVLKDYAGLDRLTARAQLESLGLIVSERPEASNTVAADLIIRTEPAANAAVKKGDEVALIYSAGITTVVVPTLEKYRLSEAKDILTKNHLVLGNVILFGANANLPEDQQFVMYSDPVAGTTVNANSTVNLTVASWDDINPTPTPTPTPEPTAEPTPTPTPTPEPTPTPKPAPTYQVKLRTSGKGNVSGADKYEVDQRVTVKASNEYGSGYEFKRWEAEDGSTASTDMVYTFAMPKKNITLTAVFEPIPTPVPTQPPAADQNPVKG